MGNCFDHATRAQEKSMGHSVHHHQAHKQRGEEDDVFGTDPIHGTFSFPLRFNSGMKSRVPECQTHQQYNEEQDLFQTNGFHVFPPSAWYGFLHAEIIQFAKP